MALMVRIVLGLLFCLLVVPGRPQARDHAPTFTNGQIQQLHASVCAAPIDQWGENGRKAWGCPHPRDYPLYFPDQVCGIAFPVSDDGKLTIYYGHFTAHREQALVKYEGCEPHANEYGGSVLFDLIDGDFKFVRYLPGYVFDHCIVPPPAVGKLQAAYCYGSSIVQGVLGQSLAKIEFSSTGAAYYLPLFAAGNRDGHTGPSVVCDGSSVAHHIVGLRYNETTSTILLDVSVRNPKTVAAACDRFRREDFNEDEQHIRDLVLTSRDYGLIRPEEDDDFVTETVLFNIPDETPITTVEQFND